MKLTIEFTTTGPLRSKRIRAQLEKAISQAENLRDAATMIDNIPGLASYRGGSHVAVHPRFDGRFADGSLRLAIVTE